MIGLAVVTILVGGAIALVRLSYLQRAGDCIVDFDLLPGSIDEVSWVTIGGWSIATSDDPDQVRWFLAALHSALPPAEPPPPDVDLSPDTAAPFALCRRDGKILVGDRHRFWLSIPGQEFWRRVRTSGKALRTSPSLCWKPGPWRVASVFDIPARGSGIPWQWKSVGAGESKNVHARAAPLVAACPSVFIAWTDTRVGGVGSPEYGDYGDTRAEDDPYEVRFSRAVSVSVIRIPWNAYYYVPKMNDGKVITKQAFVTRAVPAACDRLLVFPKETPKGSANVLYHLVGEKQWWFVGHVEPDSPVPGSPLRGR